MGHWAAESIRKHPDATVTALFDTHAGRCHALADELGIPHRFTSAEEFIGCEELDAVYIALPNKFHAPMAIESLQAGKHVLLEKPFAMNTAEAEAVIAAAEANDRAFSVAMNMRYAEDTQRVVGLSRRGALGEIYYGKAYWFRRSGIPKMGTWFGNKALAGAGALYDIGVHMLDLCLHAMGNFEPVSVSGQTFTKFGHRGEGAGTWGMSDAEGIPFDVDDFANAMIRFRNGAVVNLEVAWACHIGEANRVDVDLFGTDGGASLMPARWYRKSPETGEHETITNPDVPLALPHGCKFQNFINHLLGREELLVKPSEALAVQRILDAIETSCRTGREVALAGEMMNDE